MLKEYLTDEKYEELKKSNNSIYKALELSLILFKNASLSCSAFSDTAKKT